MRSVEKRIERPVEHKDVILEIAALAYRDTLDREFDKIAADPDIPELPPEAAAEIHNSVMRDFAQFRRKKMQKQRRRWIVRACACLVLLCTVLPFGIYQIDAARVATVNYIIKTFPEYSEIHYDEQNNALPPIGWKQPYYPTWLPEGTRVTSIEILPQGDIIRYRNIYGHEFHFIVINDIKDISAYDDENMMRQEVTINGCSAILAYSEEKNIRLLMIPIEDCILLLRGAISETDVCKIGEKINFA